MTDAIREYTLEKMKTLEKYIAKDDTSAKLTVELSKTTNHHVHGAYFQAEGHLHLRGKTTTLRTTQDDLYKAVDLLRDKLTRELASHSDKTRSVFRRGAHRVKTLFKNLM